MRRFLPLILCIVFVFSFSTAQDDRSRTAIIRNLGQITYPLDHYSIRQVPLQRNEDFDMLLMLP